MIRPATAQDFGRIVTMGEAFWAQTPLSRIPYSPVAIRHYCSMMMEQGVLRVVDEAGEVIGAAGALFAPCLGNLEYRIAAELFWWIEPAHRSAGTGQALLNALEEGARTNGAVLLSMMAFENLDPDRVGAIYERAGYKRTERTYIKGLNSAWLSPPPQ